MCFPNFTSSILLAVSSVLWPRLLFLYNIYALITAHLSQIKSVAYAATQESVPKLQRFNQILTKKTPFPHKCSPPAKFLSALFLKCEYNWACIELWSNKCTEEMWTILPELSPRNPIYRKCLGEAISHRQLSSLNTAIFLLYWL